MRFEEAYGGWQEKRLTQEEAANLLGVCERTFRRYRERYREEGLEGLVDRRLEQVSHRRALVDEVMRVTERYRARHVGGVQSIFTHGIARMEAHAATLGSRAVCKRRG
ncbi:MAG: helix-turn-helix domain-containing protein [Nitrosospira sp.]